MRQLQSIVGLLNFACAVIIPGRAFLRRIINLQLKLQAPHHHTTLTREAKEDMQLWLTFLSNFNGKAFFMESKVLCSYEINLYTDASGSVGYGAVFGSSWFAGVWSEW